MAGMYENRAGKMTQKLRPNAAHVLYANAHIFILRGRVKIGLLVCYLDVGMSFFACLLLFGDAMCVQSTKQYKHELKIRQTF